jgi:hypothetical protein
MTEPVTLDFPDGGRATALRVSTPEEIPGALAALGVLPQRPTVVVIGGAGGLAEADLERLRSLFADAIAPVIAAHRGAGVDGGTRSGVMRLFGETRAAAGEHFPLIGVVAKGTVRLPGDRTPSERADLDPRHSHFLLVPGDQGGDDSPWIAQVAGALAGDAPSVTVLINGGPIALHDVEHSLDAGREVIVIDGSGRTADALAAALAGAPTDERTAAVAGRSGMRVLSADDPAGLARALAAVLGATT